MNSRIAKSDFMSAFALLKLSVVLPALIVGMWFVQEGRAEIAKVNVYTSGTEGYNRYRIPTIVKAANGDLLAFAEARAGGDASDIDIVVKRSLDSGVSWGPLHVVMDNADFAQYLPPGAQDITVGNQSPVVDMLDPVHPGRIWMPFTLENDRVFVTHSDDYGSSWAPPTEITSTTKDPTWGHVATGPVHGIQLERGPHAGRLIIPSDHKTAGVAAYGAHVIYSDDHGQSWELGSVETHIAQYANVSPNENVAVELVDGRVYFNARNQDSADPSTRSINYSSDGGGSYDGVFINEHAISTPIVQNSALRLWATDAGDDRNVILYSSPGDPDSRLDLTIHVSLNESASWTQETLIHSGPSAYSDLVKLSNNEFGVLFEAGDALYDEILFSRMEYSDLAAPDWNGVVGDINQDGAFTENDLSRFIEVWTPVSSSVYDNDYDSYINGDMNFNGINDLGDVYAMRQALLSAGLTADRLESVLQVPESTSCALLAAAALISRMRTRTENNSI